MTYRPDPVLRIFQYQCHACKSGRLSRREIGGRRFCRRRRQDRFRRETGAYI